MQHWHSAFLGRRRIPREISAFELEAFFTFTGEERRAERPQRVSSGTKMTSIVRAWARTSISLRSDR